MLSQQCYSYIFYGVFCALNFQIIHVSPISVSGGGTGHNSLTSYALLAGGTTSTDPLQSLVAVGSSGQVLTSNGAGVLPTWQTIFVPSTGNVTTVQPISVIQLQFSYNINSDLIETAVTGTGSVTSVANFASLQTGVSKNSSATLKSKVRLCCQPGQSCTTTIAAVFTKGVANSIQTIGIGNAQDGFFFGFDGTTFGILHRVNFVDTWTPQTSWNQDILNGVGASEFTLDHIKGNVYKIQFQWVEFGLINFFIENPNTKALILVHQMHYFNTNGTTALVNPTMQLMAEVINTTNATNVTLKNFAFLGLVEGYVNHKLGVKRCVNTGSVAVVVPNNAPAFNSILTIRNNSAFMGKINQMVIYPEFLSLMNTSSGGDLLVSLYVNPAFSTALTYFAVNAAVSAVDFSKTVTTIIDGTGIALSTIYVAGGSTTNFINLFDYDLELNPGDVLSIGATRINGAGKILASLSWRERF